MWLFDLLNLIIQNRRARKEIARLEAEIAADGYSTEQVEEPLSANQVTIGENGLYYIVDTLTGVQVGNAMNSFTATYTLEQLSDPANPFNTRYEIREYTI